MTLSQLQVSVQKEISEDYTIETFNVMTQEIADRLSGKSKVKSAPQVAWS